MARNRKPSRAQFRLIVAILERGAVGVPGPELFHVRRGIEAATITITSCREHGWVKRDERDGVAYWTVTWEGRAAAERTDRRRADNALWRGRANDTPTIKGRL